MKMGSDCISPQQVKEFSYFCNRDIILSVWVTLMKIPRHKLTITCLMRRKGSRIIKKHTNKGKGNGKAIHLQAYLGPEGSRRLRLPDFETVGISVRVWVDPRAIVRPEEWCHVSCFALCKKKVQNVYIHWRWSLWAISRQELRLSFKYQTGGKAHPLPLPNTFFFTLYESSVISLCIYHLSQMIFNKIKNSKFNWNILQRRRTLSRIKHWKKYMWNTIKLK